MQTKNAYKRQTSFKKNIFKGLEGNNQYIYSDFLSIVEFCIFPSFLLVVYIHYLKFNIQEHFKIGSPIFP